MREHWASLATPDRKFLCIKSVPEVLLSGDHAKVKQWAQDESEKLTQTRRPDLIKT